MTDYKDIATKLNHDLGKTDLVMLTFGNASVVNSERSRVYIKPSGVDYKFKNDNISVVSLETGELIEGLNPQLISIFI